MESASSGAAEGATSPGLHDIVVGALTISAERVIANRSAVASEGSAAAVKQMRVGTRRLRAALQLFAPVLDEAWVSEQRDALRSLAEPLGRVRDADVLETRLKDAAASAPIALPTTQVAALVTLATTQRAAAIAEAQAGLNGDRWTSLLDGLAAAMGNPPLRVLAAGPGRATDEPGDDGAHVSRTLASRRWRKLRRMARAIGSDATDETLHELRIAVKRCRYALLALHQLFGDEATPAAAALARLQDVLGEQHDAAVTAAWCVQHRRGIGAHAAGAIAVIEAQRSHATARRWQAAWRAVDKRELWRFL